MIGFRAIIGLMLGAVLLLGQMMDRISDAPTHSSPPVATAAAPIGLTLGLEGARILLGFGMVMMGLRLARRRRMQYPFLLTFVLLFVFTIAFDAWTALYWNTSVYWSFWMAACVYGIAVLALTMSLRPAKQ